MVAEIGHVGDGHSNGVLVRKKYRIRSQVKGADDVKRTARFHCVIADVKTGESSQNWKVWRKAFAHRPRRRKMNINLS